jgi:MFS family permease
VRPRDYYVNTFSILKENPNFRTYVLVRCLLALGAIFNLGLFAGYAINEYHVSRAVVSGVFTAAQMTGSVLAAALAGKIADRFGFRVTLLSGVVMAAVMLLLALALQWLAPFATAVFIVIYFLAGAQGSAIWVANFNLMISFGRVEDRPRYIALAMLFAAPIALTAALLSGLLADFIGYRAVMALALAVIAAVWVAVFRVFREPGLHPAGRRAAPGPEAAS